MTMIMINYIKIQEVKVHRTSYDQLSQQITLTAHENTQMEVRGGAWGMGVGEPQKKPQLRFYDDLQGWKKLRSFVFLFSFP